MKLKLRPKVYAALEASVEPGGKWDLLRRGKVEEEPCCTLCYVCRHCARCPIKRFTGAPGCLAFEAYMEWGWQWRGWGIRSSQAKRAAERVYRELRGMLEFCEEAEDE